MEERATCVLPKPGITKEMSHSTSSNGVMWLGEDIDPGFEVLYQNLI